MTSADRRRVVITGMGVVSPFGLSPDELWSGLVAARSAVGPIGLFCTDGLPLHHGGEARAFTGEIDNFGALESETKKAIRKGLKVMCRESQMAVAAAQRALHDCGLPPAARVPERFGCVFGSDYMLTLPEDFTAGVAACRSETSDFEFDRWAADGMPLLNPLWLLKYLPNMPASHIAIYNDLRGPSNSLTVREASGHAAVAEATMTIQRGAADVMLAGATGTRVHPMKTVHALQSEQVALGPGEPTTWSRPFDRLRQGMVLGEGAAVLVLEELAHARKRGATIHGEVLGYASRHVADRLNIGRRREALASALRRALEMVGLASTVARLPQGVGTPLASDGLPLSANDVSRLSIARAIVGRPRLLLINGMLDRLDLRSSPELIESLFDRSAPWTPVIVTARDDIQRRCDRTVEWS